MEGPLVSGWLISKSSPIHHSICFGFFPVQKYASENKTSKTLPAGEHINNRGGSGANQRAGRE
jgi:hypothetical protein